MNSVLQILFMNPTFRQIIYDLPLCLENNIEIPSSFLDENNNNLTNKKKSQKWEILLAIQKLFIRLQFANIHSISTFNLTEAFKWEGGEGANQQDSQEFIRLFLYEILERILIGTAYDGYINNLFKLIANNYMKCSNCEAIKSREEVYLDITLPVQNYKGLKESLNELFNNEEIINDYMCDNCNKKVELKRFSKLKQLPIFINFPLNRFSFDYETFKRIKLNDKFEFPLEVDMREYFSPEVLSDFGTDFSNASPCVNIEEEFLYELYGIIVHRGTPYSGHYFSYVRDICGEGNWNLEEVREYKKEPEMPSVNLIKDDKDLEEENEKEIEKGNIDNSNSVNKKGKGKINNKKNQNQGKKNNNNNNKKSKIHYLKYLNIFIKLI